MAIAWRFESVDIAQFILNDPGNVAHFVYRKDKLGLHTIEK
jgi:hypothetical protein